MVKPKDVDSYIAKAPKESRSKLKEIRKAIKEVAPDALEKISYSMPYYGYKGRLAYFLLAKEHIGLYLRPSVLKEYKNELKGYSTSKATIRLPLNKKIPINLIKKLIKTGIKHNEEN
jgi:uncharacterized protein YdhG (YjbR/CyaY superfamily)